MLFYIEYVKVKTHLFPLLVTSVALLRHTEKPNGLNHVPLNFKWIYNTGEPSLHCDPSALLSHLEALSLCTLKGTIAKLKPSLSLLDVMSARLPKEVFNSGW